MADFPETERKSKQTQKLSKKAKQLIRGLLTSRKEKYMLLKREIMFSYIDILVKIV